MNTNETVTIESGRLRFACPACGNPMSAKIADAGQAYTCARCETQSRVPSGSRVSEARARALRAEATAPPQSTHDPDAIPPDIPRDLPPDLPPDLRRESDAARAACRDAARVGALVTGLGVFVFFIGVGAFAINIDEPDPALAAAAWSLIPAGILFALAGVPLRAGFMALALLVRVD